MKFLFDLFPIAIFFLAFWFYDELKGALIDMGVDPVFLTLHESGSTEGILVATIAAIVANVIQVSVYWARHRRVENMYWITLVLLVVMGGATLLFKEEIFIKWKPTVVHWLFALVFWGSQFVGGKSLIRRMMEGKVELPALIWHRLNTGWVLFFLFSGALNLYVVYSFSTEFWVNFKLFGLLGLTLLFGIGQSLYLMHHMKSPP